MKKPPSFGLTWFYIFVLAFVPAFIPAPANACGSGGVGIGGVGGGGYGACFQDVQHAGEAMAWGVGGAIAGASGGPVGAYLGYVGGFLADTFQQMIYGTARIQANCWVLC